MFLLLFTRNPVFPVAQQKVLRSVILCLVLYSSVGKLLAMETVQKEKFVEKSTDFGLKIFDRIVDQKGQTDGAPRSTFMSPTSINVALAMLYAGAENPTKQEMNKIIFGQMDDNVIESNVQYLSKMLNKTNDDKSGYTLTMANGMFTQENYAVLPTYVKMLRDLYATQAESVDFNTKQALIKINQWVAQKTNQKITKLCEELDANTRLVLANAIYFKGDWHTKFDAANTVDTPFHVTEQKSKQLPFMRARNKFFHFNDQDQDWSVLGMPYKSQQLMMTVFLPKEEHRFQLNALQKQLTGAKLWKLIDGLKLHDKRELDVQMPKFKFETKADLVECLQAMGVTSMFTSGQANLLKISSANDLFVSAIVHKAVVEVNEEGSEAAAVTGVAVSTRSMPMYDRFLADHPFLFAIVDKTSRSLLFLGQFYG